MNRHRSRFRQLQHGVHCAFAGRIAMNTMNTATQISVIRIKLCRRPHSLTESYGIG
jgi:hypothetical protein